MKEKKKTKKASYQNFLVPGAIGLVFLLAIGFLVKVVLSDSAPRQKERISRVTLLKPPPEVKEKLPEPEVPKDIPKESMSTPVEIAQPQDQAQDQQDAAPAGADLGVEGDGAAGSDGFGLTAKKKGTGRDVTLGGGGGGGLNRLALMAKYGWYTSKVQEEIKKQMRKQFDQDGGIPKGKYQTTVKILLDAKGAVVKYQILALSGNDRVDEALKGSLPGFRISQPPPEGMPSGMTVRIVSQG
ncbi:MAG: TonB C-terminal domain-containing protein [Desulfuromonadales bacterium]